MNTLSDNNWILSVGTFLPMAGVLIMLFIPRREETLVKQVGIWTLFLFNYDKAGDQQFFVSTSWIKPIRATYTIGLDGMSLPMYILSMVITLLVMIYSWDHIPEPGNPKAFFILMLILQMGMAGTFIAQDLILFFVFFEIVLLPMYFMIGVWGGEKRRYAAMKFFLYTLFGSALMIISFMALYFLSDKVPVPGGGFAHTFDMRVLPVAAAGISTSAGLWIFGGMFMGFGIKVPMFPFHTWLPDAHTQAPTVGSVILAAVLLKLGTYG